MSCGISVEPNCCLNMYHKNSKCSDCTATCPSGAIHIGKPGTTLYIDKQKCLGCELCQSACSNGVFYRSGITEISWCKKLVEKSTNGTISIGCGDSEESSDARLVCIGSLHALHLLHLAIYGIRTFDFFTGNCSQCRIQRGQERLVKTIDTLVRFTQNIEGASIEVEYSKGKSRLTLTSFPVGLLLGQNNPEVTRRHMFRLVGLQACHTIANTLEAADIGENLRVGVEGETIRSQRRRLLHLQLMHLQPYLKNEMTYVPGVPVGSISIDAASCRQCRLCILLCPSGALTADPDGSPVLIGTRCSGCGICTIACAQGCLANRSSWPS